MKKLERYTSFEKLKASAADTATGRSFVKLDALEDFIIQLRNNVIDKKEQQQRRRK
jgi:hypothetical protein